METDGKLYLGRVYDLGNKKVTDQSILYDPADLTTHGIVVGMTGSGKTGLCLDLMEEAALQQIPALMIDPKGDITNALLHFPDLLPADFQPWINPDETRRSGKTPEQAAKDTAELWRSGLADWDITPDRIRSLAGSVQFTVYTPGSDAGVPVSILASLQAPGIPWESNRETLREQIAGTVTALLGLVGMEDVDPVRSREHILLSNLFENAWSQGKDLTLGELILQTQNPPFDKLGVFDVNTFFPEKDRFSLAMLLNNILAAPSFQAWIEGQPLDVAGLLFTPDGRPRHSIFYIAHLNDAERMFIITLLFSAIDAWMRKQAGATSLRALVYFDEIYGYLPPTRNPASKVPMLRLLKQARAFGVGLLLATQNPVDVDYKALSNAGSWFIGKLQTDQDKQRLLDGLQGAAPGIDRQTYDHMLSSLGKRVFLLHNVHEKAPALFQTRWAMNYLAGPLTRTQIPALNQLAGVGDFQAAPMPASPSAITPESAPAAAKPPVPTPAATPVKAAAAAGGAELTGTETRPSVPTRVEEYFLPNNLTLTQAFKQSGQVMPPEAQLQALVYHPVLVGQASIRFLVRKYDLDSELIRSVLVRDPDRRGFVRWEEYPAEPINERELDREPDPRGRYAALEMPLSDERLLANLRKDFEEWIYRSSEVKVLSNPYLKLYAGPEVSTAEFRQQSAEAARQQRDAEIDKQTASYDKKIAALQAKIDKEQRELDQDETELSQRKMEEYGTYLDFASKLFSKRSKSLSTPLNKRRMSAQAKADVEESKKAIADYQKQIADLEQQKAEAIQEVKDRWGEQAAEVEEIAVTPTKSDISVELFGVAWFPYHVVQTLTGILELPGYGRV
jgi:hypothetical protein